MLDRPNPRHFRTLFLSDVHLGSKACQARLLLDFLRCHDAETIYLVGDIVDGWRLKRSWYWPQEHNDVVQKLLRKARKGSRIVYIPGNHDEFLRDYIGTHFGGVEVAARAVHETADGRRLLVIHGDEFDVVVRHARWLALFGDSAYEVAVSINTVLNRIRRRLGFGYWSLSAWLKLKVKNAVNYIGAFEEALSQRGQAGRRRRRRLRPYPPRPHRRHQPASATSTPATGWKAARRSPSTTTAGSRSSAGRSPLPILRKARVKWRPASPARQPSEAPPHRDRCLAAAGERRRPHA